MNLQYLCTEFQLGGVILDIRDISVPEIYKSSSDFRFFIEWFADALTQTQYDIEHTIDCYDPLRCKSELLWMLGETMGYKLDDRLPTAFNRLVILYFMSLIRNKGSKDGVTLAAEVNLAQFNILNYGKENDILYDRLEDTSIPVNAAYVNSHPADGYIDVVYFSTDLPIDSCLEYVRPVGMYMFQHAGVRVDARSKISVDARLMNDREHDLTESIGPTRVGHYSREDFARMQRMTVSETGKAVPDSTHKRSPNFYRNSDVEVTPTSNIDNGYRAISSLQLCNNEHIVKSLLSEPIFTLGFGPQDVSTEQPGSYLTAGQDPKWNLELNRTLEKQISENVYVNDEDRTSGPTQARPAVGPIMGHMGEAIPIPGEDGKFTKYDDSTGSIVIDNVSDTD